MTEKPKLPKRVLIIIETMQKNHWKLCKHLHHKETGETEVAFHFEPSGKRCGPKSAQAAIKSGLLVPGNDGLFSAETSQTWTA